MKLFTLNQARGKLPRSRVASLASVLFVSHALAQGPNTSDAQNPVHTSIHASTPPELTFQEFFKTPIGPRGMEFTSKALALRGHEITLRGFMVKTDLLHQGRFLLAPKALEVNEEDDGPANDLPVHTVLVRLDPSQENLVLTHQEGIIQVQGKLELGREENSLGEVSWIRLIAAPLQVNILSSGADQTHKSNQSPALHQEPSFQVPAPRHSLASSDYKII